ncbi:hypothetical protein BSKO_08475 [Bryopsis sp. KO-2023]|nr:hypothetical protein BSKO_08475 [Bryopsis sp. KO-2023]
MAENEGQLGYDSDAGLDESILSSEPAIKYSQTRNACENVAAGSQNTIQNQSLDMSNNGGSKKRPHLNGGGGSAILKDAETQEKAGGSSSRREVLSFLTLGEERFDPGGNARTEPVLYRFGSQRVETFSSKCEDPRETASCHQFSDPSGTDDAALRETTETGRLNVDADSCRSSAKSVGAMENDCEQQANDGSQPAPEASDDRELDKVAADPSVMLSRLGARFTCGGKIKPIQSSRALQQRRSQELTKSNSTAHALKRDLEATRREILEAIGEDDRSLSEGSVASSLSYTPSQIDGLSRVQEHMGSYFPILQAKGFKMSFQEAFSVGQELLNRQRNKGSTVRSRTCSPTRSLSPTKSPERKSRVYPSEGKGNQSADLVQSTPERNTERYQSVVCRLSSRSSTPPEVCESLGPLSGGDDRFVGEDLPSMAEDEEKSPFPIPSSNGGGEVFELSPRNSLSSCPTHERTESWSSYLGALKDNENDGFSAILDHTDRILDDHLAASNAQEMLPQYQEKLKRLSDTLGRAERELESRQRHIIRRINKKKKKAANERSLFPEFDGKPISFWVLPPKDRGLDSKRTVGES